MMIIGKIICLTEFALLIYACLSLINQSVLIRKRSHVIFDYFRVRTSVSTTRNHRYRANDRQVESEANLLSDPYRSKPLGYRV